MKRAFYLLDELGDIVEAKPRPQITKIAGRDLEPPPLRGGAPALQPPPQRLVHDLAKGPASALGLRLKLGRDVVIEGQRRPHALML